MVAYPITRFLIEYLRNDEAVFFAGMTISQNISVALPAGGLVYWAWLSHAAGPGRPPAPATRETAEAVAEQADRAPVTHRSDR